MIRNWMKMLLAILLGNLVYFLLMPYLPQSLGHSKFQIDPGLLFDLALCAAFYLLIRKIV